MANDEPEVPVPATPAPDRGETPADPSPDAEADAGPDTVAVGPTEAEVAAWAEQERERRRAWLEGPSDAEREAWARRERSRRRAEIGMQARAVRLARQSRRYSRDTQLATEGAMNLFWRWSRRTFDEFVQAGREWEEEASRWPGRRVQIDDEDR